MDISKIHKPKTLTSTFEFHSKLFNELQNIPMKVRNLQYSEAVSDDWVTLLKSSMAVTWSLTHACITSLWTAQKVYPWILAPYLLDSMPLH